MTERVKRERPRKRKPAVDRLLELLKTNEWNEAIELLNEELKADRDDRDASM